jgi:hypothetical protein
MDGTPPFTRHPVKSKFLTRQSAGHALQLRHAALLFHHGPFKFLESARAVWVLMDCSGGGVIAAVRLQEKDPHVSKVRVTGRFPQLTLRTSGLLGNYETVVRLGVDPFPNLRATVRLTTVNPVKLNLASREVILTDARHRPLKEGLLFTTQTGPTAGQAFVAAKCSTLFYFQNLSALATYTALTGTSLESAVGVDWPEIGLQLPAGSEPLPKGASLVISDVFLRVTAGIEGEAKRAIEFMDGMAWAYRNCVDQAGPWFDWAEVAARTVKALRKSKDCLRKIQGSYYLNAYVGSDYKPPESMVQAAIRVPLVEYEGWLLKAQPLARSLAGNLQPFFLKELGSMARWLPGEKFLRDSPSEEEEAERMDSWYLLHTMMNLGRLAELGKSSERKLFLDCLDYVVRVARHFHYDWPVFYHRKTLEVLKREKGEGQGGEQDAAGLYAHVMVQAWQITADRKYLQEAEASAAKLSGLGFGVLYQTNNTVFTAFALARLWKQTGNALYRDLSFVCVGSVLSHLWMWEPSRPGHTWRTFMGLPPLHDAPYIAPYEEGEVFACFRAYLAEMADEAPSSLVELLVEYGRHLLGRARYYLPEEIPPHLLCDSPKEGIVDRNLPVPVEDIYPSMLPAGQVGQELYGAALALILTTHAFHRWRKVPFMVWCEAPLASAAFTDGDGPGKGSLRFKVNGPGIHRYGIRLMPIPHGKGKVSFEVRREESGKRKTKLRPQTTAENHIAFDSPGTAWIEVLWKMA